MQVQLGASQEGRPVLFGQLASQAISHTMSHRTMLEHSAAGVVHVPTLPPKPPPPESPPPKPDEVLVKPDDPSDPPVPVNPPPTPPMPDEVLVNPEPPPPKPDEVLVTPAPPPPKPDEVVVVVPPPKPDELLVAVLDDEVVPVPPWPLPSESLPCAQLPVRATPKSKGRTIQETLMATPIVAGFDVEGNADERTPVGRSP